MALSADSSASCGAGWQAVFGEHHDELGGGSIAFYDQAKLGGSGLLPRLSGMHRGFVHNRFYGESAVSLNLEYRYTIWEYQAFKMNAALFFDEGQVFNEFNDFEFKDFRESYGVGFYITHDRKSMLNLTVARSDEGTQLYLKNRLVF